MPEMEFSLRWPDGQESRCYSPSLVIEEHLVPGADYPLPEFLTRCRAALNEASRRVQARYGFACSRAMATLAAIEEQATPFAPEAQVHVLGFRRLP
jgi:uncharacterized repeat protein (TIGR04042 family)